MVSTSSAAGLMSFSRMSAMAASTARAKAAPTSTIKIRSENLNRSTSPGSNPSAERKSEIPHHDNGCILLGSPCLEFIELQLGSACSANQPPDATNISNQVAEAWGKIGFRLCDGPWTIPVQPNRKNPAARVEESRSIGGIRRAMKFLLSELGCPPIRKQYFENGGLSGPGHR